MDNARARAWVFTVNNPQGGAELYAEAAAACRYLIIGNEVAPTTGTPHHQGYVVYPNPVRFNTVRQRLPEGAHIERARGTGPENREYCSKEAVLVEVGDVPVQGKRTDLEVVREMVTDGWRMVDIIDEVRNYQAIRCAEALLRYKEAKRNWRPAVYWYWGPTGTGKTRTVMERAPNAWISGKSLRWWDGYDAHEDVLIDDFRGDFCTFHELLRILDRYPYRVETKGGSRQLLARRIFITAPFHPRSAYQTIEDKTQLLRRIDEIRYFPELDTDVPAQESGVILEPGQPSDSDLDEYLEAFFAEKEGSD